jgi:hypothetical protein
MTGGFSRRVQLHEVRYVDKVRFRKDYETNLAVSSSKFCRLSHAVDFIVPIE